MLNLLPQTALFYNVNITSLIKSEIVDFMALCRFGYKPSM